MPYKDPEKRRENDARRNARAKARRVEDPVFLAKEKLARRTYINNKYHTDPDFKLRRNRDRVVSKYGLTSKQYTEMLGVQNYVCAICKTPHMDENGKRLVIDHNHLLENGAVRGLLCSPCNLGLGQFKDSPAVLRAAAKYLEQKL